METYLIFLLFKKNTLFLLFTKMVKMGMFRKLKTKVHLIVECGHIKVKGPNNMTPRPVGKGPTTSQSAIITVNLGPTAYHDFWRGAFLFQSNFRLWRPPLFVKDYPSWAPSALWCFPGNHSSCFGSHSPHAPVWFATLDLRSTAPCLWSCVSREEW